MDFSTYPDNTTLGPTYIQAGFSFTQLGSKPVMFANATAGQIGLQFPDPGHEIKLRAPTQKAMIDTTVNNAPRDGYRKRLL